MYCLYLSFLVLEKERVLYFMRTWLITLAHCMAFIACASWGLLTPVLQTSSLPVVELYILLEI